MKRVLVSSKPFLCSSAVPPLSRGSFKHLPNGFFFRTAATKVGGMAPLDGNTAASHVAYAMSDVAFIYPISPATSMGELVDSWATEGRKNCFGKELDVYTMQSEGGAAGALHGSLACGSLTTTFTASQGLLLMIPNMYLIAGELMPTVFHVSARTVSKHALSIFNDHSDVMAVRQTGFAMLCSHSVQEVMDLGLVAHLATLKSRIPFVHFFDGYRTSAEISKINVIPYEAMQSLIPHDKIKENLYDKALNPNHPIIRGTGQRPDIFFQATVAANKYYQATPKIVQEVMDEVGALTGRPYKLFDYVGPADANQVAVVLGSASSTLQEATTYLNAKGEKLGLLKVRLFRPWDAEAFRAALPKTAEKIVVLDRTREDGASGNPLYLDVCASLSEVQDTRTVIGGQYGLASKEFTPAMAKAVFDNLGSPNPKRNFVVGINDDVTHTSLAIGEEINCVPAGTKQCMFWGVGTDGTVGANKNAIKMISNATDLYAQGHFAYDSHKGGGVTISHLRFGPSPITSEYEINKDADYIACHHPSYVEKFDHLLEPAKENGIFVLNTNWNAEELTAHLPKRMKQTIAKKNLQFYTIDATKIASDLGLKNRINMIMQAAFFKLSGVLPEEQSIKLLKQNIETAYGKKGPAIVNMNKQAVDSVDANLTKIMIPASWKTAESGPGIATCGPGYDGRAKVPDFITKIMDPVLALRGDELPVSTFEAGGYMPAGTTHFEKRGIAPIVPVWKPENCTQCNYCSIVCPHAVIRPFLLDLAEVKGAPAGYKSLKAQGGAEFSGLNYSIQVSPFDCTGCEVCVQSCPDDALFMDAFDKVSPSKPHWDYSTSLPERGTLTDKMTVKGSQFQKPLMEFSGACAGCGETPYVKLLTQLFGERMVIANASGCSSVWGGTATTNPYTVTSKGKGPAWGRSLFEDNAEYGLGMQIATFNRRRALKLDVENALANCKEMSPELQKELKNWQKVADAEQSATVAEKLSPLLRQEKDSHPILKKIHDNADLLPSISHWIIGGDGWAYDIGYGGLDHVLSRGENVNVLVLDTEMYSNTGGQVSKASPMASVVKFASSGKPQAKKDLGQMAMMYNHVYVASVALGASYNQCVKAFQEAEAYPGPSLIIAYSPCIDWGIDMKEMMDVQKLAVDSGYWSLYRFNPSNSTKGLNPFMLDSKRIKTDISSLMKAENRFMQLSRGNPERAKALQESLSSFVKKRHQHMQRKSLDDFELLDMLKKSMGEETGEKMLILYGSETGNTEDLAKTLEYEMKRRDVRAVCMAMDDFDVNELPDQKVVINLVATCGQGEFPGNCKSFWEQLSDPELPSDFLKDTKFTVFGMGDSGYVFFNRCASQIDERLQELGGNRILAMGLGDDQDEDRWETAWEEWSPELWNELGTKPPPQTLLPASHLIAVTPGAEADVSTEPYLPPGSKSIRMTESRLLTPGGRDNRHYEFDTAGMGMGYRACDSLGIYPKNHTEEVLEFLDWYGLYSDDLVKAEDLTGTLSNPLPPLTTGQLFTDVLDIFGRPKRRFYEMLGIMATDDAAKKELGHLISKEGKDDMRALITETTTHADLMKKYNIHVPIEYMLDFVPKIKPRLYSIASGPELVGEKVQLCIVEEDWTTPSGKYRKGACTSYLRTLKPEEDAHVCAAINSGSMEVPTDPKLPLVMCALGTGLAPFRAILQDRQAQRARGEEVGPVTLFFGARYRATEYIYGDELDAWLNDGLINELIHAFSRDQEKKVYVQDRLDQNRDLLWERLVKQGGSFFYCGTGGRVPDQVQEQVVKSFVSAGKVSQEEAENIVTDMRLKSRYCVEAW